MDRADAPDLLRHHRRLTARLARCIGRSDAEDLASEAVARGLDHPAPDGRQGAWIERIFRNLVIDRGRGRARNLARLARGPEGPFAPSAEELLLEHERRGALLEAIPAIPEQLRQALLARFYEERDYDGLAADLGISTATARTRVHRALSRLRGAMTKLRGFIPATSTLGAYSTPAQLLPALLTIAVITLDANPPRDAPVGAPVHVAGGPAPEKSVQQKDAAPSSGSLPPNAAAPSGPRPTHAKTERRTTTTAGSAPVPTTPAAPAPKRFDFDDDDIEAELDRPAFEFLVGDDRRAAHRSLIDVPRSLVPSLLKALEDL